MLPRGNIVSEVSGGKLQASASLRSARSVLAETDGSSEASQITPRLGRRQKIAARSVASSVAARKDWTSVVNFNSERRMKDRASREDHGASKEKPRCT